MNEEQAKPRVLLIDDEESICLSARYTLDKWYDLIYVHTAAEGIELLKKEKFDLVLLDILLRVGGEKEGLDALKAISQNYPHLPIVMISGSMSWMKRWEELKRLGAYGYLSKPFEKYKANGIIARCLGGEKMDKIIWNP